MLLQRMLTAVIGIPIAVFVINYGQWVFGAAVSLLALIGWYEYSNIMKNKDIKVPYWLGFVGIVFFMACAGVGNSDETLIILFFITLLTLLQIVLSQQKFTLYDAAFTMLGINYVGILFSFLLLLRFSGQDIWISTPLGSISQGAAYLWLAFIGTWASDTFAYFVGSLIGRNKLCPAISPGKTVEGAIGGLLGSVLGVIVLCMLFKIALIHAVMIGILVGITAPLGDLVESSIKRFAKVKDSGKLLPGHGGVLDRFDSIIFAVPAVYFYIRFILQ